MINPWTSVPLDAAPARRELRLVLLATLGVSLYLLACSIGTLPVLGDESQHFRRATVYFNTGFPLTRVTHDPAFPATGISTIRYYDAALWHMALALLWRAIGQPWLLLAQVYHVVFFFGLGMFAYLTGRELYGRRGGLWAWALVITIPMNLLFGMVFYLEVPLLALAAAATYCVIRRRPILLGLSLAAMLLTKAPSAAVLTPPLLAAALLTIGDTWRIRIGRVLLAVGVALAVMAPEAAWRIYHFGNPLMFSDSQFGLECRYEVAPPRQSAVPFSIMDLYVDFQMFGATGILATLAGIFLALWCLGRDGIEFLRVGWTQGPRALVRSMHDLSQTDAWVIGLPLVAYVLGFIVMLRGAWDCRYFQPTVFFSSVLAGGLLARWRPFAYAGRLKLAVRLAAAVLVLGILGQAVSVPLFLHFRRTLDPQVAAGYEWIRRNTPPQARFLYLEVNLAAMTGRPIVWAAAMPRYLFNVPESEQVRILHQLGIQYVAIHPTRQSDKSFDPEVEICEYPKPWIRSLPGRPYMTRVYPPGDLDSLEGRFLIFQVDPTKMPKEWTQDSKPGTRKAPKAEAGK